MIYLEEHLLVLTVTFEGERKFNHDSSSNIEIGEKKEGLVPPPPPRRE